MKLCWSNNTKYWSSIEGSFFSEYYFSEPRAQNNLLLLVNFYYFNPRLKIPHNIISVPNQTVAQCPETGPSCRRRAAGDMIKRTRSRIVLTCHTPVSPVKLDYQLEILLSQYNWPARPVPTLKLIGNFLKLVLGADDVWEWIMSVWTSTKN